MKEKMNENEPRVPAGQTGGGQWMSLKMPSSLTQQDKAKLVNLGARHNGIPYGKPGSGWEAPSSTHAAAQAVLGDAMTRQGKANASSIAGGKGRCAI
jgi:hypothetical protein